MRYLRNQASTDNHGIIESSKYNKKRNRKIIVNKNKELRTVADWNRIINSKYPII